MLESSYNSTADSTNLQNQDGKSQSTNNYQKEQFVYLPQPHLIPSPKNYQISQPQNQTNILDAHLLEDSSVTGKSDLVLSPSGENLSYLPTQVNIPSYQSSSIPYYQTKMATTGLNAAQIYLEQGLAYWEAKKWKETIQACQRAIEINPQLVEAYKTIGNALQQEGRLPEAIGYYARAIEIQPNFPEAYANLGTLYAQQGKWQQALSHYEKALQLKPDFPGVYKQMARVWKELGNQENAQRMLAQAQHLQSQPQLSPEQFFNLGEQARQYGNFQQARDYYQQAVKLIPNWLEAYQRLAEVTEGLGLWQETAIHYRKILELRESLATRSLPPGGANRQLPLLGNNPQNRSLPQLGPVSQAIPSNEAQIIQQEFQRAAQEPNSAEAQANLGNLYAKQQKWHEAIVHYQKAIKINPNLASAYRNLGRILTKIGKTDQATSYWLKAIDLEAQGVKADEYLQLGNVLSRQGKFNKAITCYRRAIQLQPNLVEAYLHLGKLFNQAGQKEQAILCYQQGIKYYPENPQLHFNLGVCLTEQQQWEQGIRCYHKAIQLKSDYWEALHNLGEAYSRQQRWTEAVGAYRRVIELNPQFPWSYNNLGNVLIQLNKFEEAVTCLRKAISMKGDFVWSYYNLGEALSHLGKWPEAIAAYEAAGKMKADLPYLQQKLGHAFFSRSQGDKQKALKYFMQAIEQDPKDPNNYHQALAIDKNNLELYLSLGNTLVEQKRLDEAIAAYQMAIQLQPKNVEAALRLSNALMEKDPSTDVKELVNRLLDSQPSIEEDPVEKKNFQFPLN